HWVVRSAYWIPLACFFAARGAMEGARRLIDDKKDRSGVWALLVGASLAAALALGVPAGLPSFWAGGLLLLAAGWRGIRPGLRGGLLLAALGCSLLPAVQSFYFTLPQSFYQAPPLRAAAVPGTRIFHAPDLLDATKTVSGSTAQQACGKPKELLMPNWPLLEGLEEAGVNNTLCLREFLRWYYAPQEAPAGSRKKFLDYLNAGLVLGWTAPPGAPRPIAGFPVPVWIDPTPLPKWFCASRARLEGGWPLDFETMAKPGYDFARDCFVADPERVGSYAPRPVEMDRPSPNGVELEVGGKGRALLVSSELAYPGWKARVAGEDRGLEVVNHSFRGLALGSGERRVALRYDPGSVRLGLFGLLLALGLWIFTAWGLLAPGKAAHGRA
ncbi:MAG TPA: hypothetical protein VFR02_00230, partial [bacterium]|nr:hypothetical protein [bacterium]